MDLELQEVADLLNVPQNLLLNWAIEGKVPTYRMKESYRFNRQEIEAWVMSQQKLIQQEEAESKAETSKRSGLQRFNLFRALNNGDVFSDIDARTKEGVIGQTMKRIAPLLSLDPDVLTEIFMDREQLASTAVGAGFAIPHARDFLLHGHRDVVVVVYLPQPIDYEALDAQPVHTLFFLLASDDKKHLGLLSKIAHLASTPVMLELLRQKPGKSELLEVVKNWETALLHRPAAIH